VLDTVGGEVQQRSYSVLKPGGTLVAINQPPSEKQAAKYKVKASMLVTEASVDSLQAVARLVDRSSRPILSAMSQKLGGTFVPATSMARLFLRSSPPPLAEVRPPASADP
jgi:NADPH:quinone reductase-like Zn-dependent oxidoreductase